MSREIPFDAWDNVLEFVPPSTLVQLCLVSRSFRDIVTPRLYGQVTLESTIKTILFSKAVLRTQYAADSVNYLQLVISPVTFHPHSRRSSLGNLFQLISHCLKVLSNLVHLSIVVVVVPTMSSRELVIDLLLGKDLFFPSLEGFWFNTPITNNILRFLDRHCISLRKARATDTTRPDPQTPLNFFIRNFSNLAFLRADLELVIALLPLAPKLQHISISFVGDERNLGRLIDGFKHRSPGSNQTVKIFAIKGLTGVHPRSVILATSRILSGLERLTIHCVLQGGAVHQEDLRDFHAILSPFRELRNFRSAVYRGQTGNLAGVTPAMGATQEYHLVKELGNKHPSLLSVCIPSNNKVSWHRIGSDVWVPQTEAFPTSTSAPAQPQPRDLGYWWLFEQLAARKYPALAELLSHAKTHCNQIPGLSDYIQCYEMSTNMDSDMKHTTASGLMAILMYAGFWWYKHVHEGGQYREIEAKMKQVGVAKMVHVLCRKVRGA
ncbi:hypothetical protein VNI00_010783 [Paramarasmius palmivorus]|uniref:F-box domain-containing protein n=1 Tax=Paramarasmius palmivorus TaxID=297713 RepID=A0AAW0CDM7_9AGAR